MIKNLQKNNCMLNYIVIWRGNMSNKNNTNTTRTSVSFRYVINCLSFFASVIIGIVLILSKVGLSGQVSNILSLVAQSLSYLVVVFAGFYYARSKRSIVYLIIWAVAAALIITGLFL